MAALSKAALRSERAIRVVSSTLRENRGVLDGGLTEFFQPYLGEGELMPVFSTVADLMARSLEDTNRTLVEADRSKLDEFALDSALRRRRDSVASNLHREIVALKGAVASGHGLEGLSVLGFARELVLEPIVVLRQTQRILVNLADPDKPLPAPVVPGTGIRPEEVTQSLEAKFEELRGILQQLDAERRETDTAQIVKNETVDKTRRVIVNLARATEAFFRLIDRDDLANRIPAVVRRALRRGRSGRAPEPTTSQTSESETGSP